MITDALLSLSAAQAVTTTAVSTNTIDLGTARDIGEGEDLYVSFLIPTTFTGGTSLVANIITSAAANLGSPTVIASTGVILLATLVAGYRFAMRIPAQLGSLGQRYLGVSYTVVGTMTAGTITADVVHDLQDGTKFYASGFTVS